MDNTVELIGYYGSDETHALSAWTSTSRELTQERKERIPKMLKQLAEAGHHTPFEKSSFHFLVTTDIASHIHIIKHRIAVSVNAESARYRELKEDKYYLPDDWIDLEANSVNFDHRDKWGNKWLDILAGFSRLSNELYHCCLEDLEPRLGRKRAKESARFFKTYNSQITADVMFNWRSFYHFLSLRNKLDAQKEIRDIAGKMLKIVKELDGNPFKYTLEAFGFEN